MPVQVSFLVEEDAAAYGAKDTKRRAYFSACMTLTLGVLGRCVVDQAGTRRIDTGTWALSNTAEYNQQLRQQCRKQSQGHLSCCMTQAKTRLTGTSIGALNNTSSCYFSVGSPKVMYIPLVTGHG